jgi:type VI protein secretion system component VasF
MSPISAGSKSRKKKNTLWIVLSAALAALVFLFNFWSGETSVDTGDLNGMDSALHDLQRNFWTQR